MVKKILFLIILAWISFPVQFYAQEALFSIASAVGTPLVVDKVTNSQTRPSVARVRVEVDLLSSLPDCVRLYIREDNTGDLQEIWQKVVYDRLPSYCSTCKHQGHEASSCHHNSKSDEIQEGLVQPSLEADTIEQLNGDARAYLNAKRAENKVNENPAPVQNPGKQLSAIENDNIIGGNQIVATDGQTDTFGIGPSGQEKPSTAVPKFAIIGDTNNNNYVPMDGEEAARVVDKGKIIEASKTEGWTVITYKNPGNIRIGCPIKRNPPNQHEKHRRATISDGDRTKTGNDAEQRNNM